MNRKKQTFREKQKKTIVPICIALALTLAVLVGLAASWMFFQNDEREPEVGQAKEADYSLPPDVLLRQYYERLSDGKYDEMYEMLDEISRSDITKEAFVTRNKNIYGGIEAKNIRLEILDADMSDKTEPIVLYNVKMDTSAGEIAFKNRTIFELSEKGSYGIYWDDGMIFPELSAKDKVWVSTDKGERGSIYDRNGRLLAGEGTASSVGLVPGKMNADSSDDIQKLADILGMSKKSIKKKLKAEWVKTDSFVPLKTVEKLTELEQMADVPSEDTLKKIERDAALLAIPGVIITDTKLRQYPLGKMASHLIGYIQQVTAEDLKAHPNDDYYETSVIGRSGVEALYEEKLRGRDGRTIRIVNAQGDTKTVLASKEKKDGEDIYLTIDAGLQETIYNTFAEEKSCSVAMHPYTGEVLALVSTPTFDSNDFIFGMTEKMWTSLNEDKNMPLSNRFLQKLCPGSSFKPIIAAVGLKTGAINPQEDFGYSGLRWQNDSSWGSYYVTTLHAYEPAILKNALIYSDNIYFAKAALKIGKEELINQLNHLGFAQELPFELSTAKSQYANDGEITSEIQLADSGYGQGQVLVNPIHMAALYSGFVNNGDLVTPRLLYEKETAGKSWITAAYDPTHAQLIKEALIQVVASGQGTGHAAYRAEVTLAGKTGTAEIKKSKDDTDGTELGWFAVFTADENEPNPLLLVSMTEDVKNRGGSRYVVEKDKLILDVWFAER